MKKMTLIFIVLQLSLSSCNPAFLHNQTNTPANETREIENSILQTQTETPLKSTATIAITTQAVVIPTNTPEPKAKPFKDGWQFIETANFPEPRAEHAMVILPDESILMYGGRSEHGVLGDVWIFTFDEYVDVHSGRTGLMSLRTSPVAQGNWNQLEIPNSPGPLAGHSMIVLNDGRVAMFGGEDYGGDLQNGILIRENNEWNILEPSNASPPARSHHLALYHDGFMYIQGGMGISTDGKKTIYDDLWRYDISGDTWEQLPSPPEFISPNAFPIVDNGQIRYLDPHRYSYSGNRDLIFDIATEQWTLSAPVANPPSGERYGFTEVRKENDVYVMGGATYDQSTQRSNLISDVLVFDISTDTWRELEENEKLPIPVLDGVAVYDPILNGVIVWGGRQDQDGYIPGNQILIYVIPSG